LSVSPGRVLGYDTVVTDERLAANIRDSLIGDRPKDRHRTGCRFIVLDRTMNRATRMLGSARDGLTATDRPGDDRARPGTAGPYANPR
jgi:hypothetical protein